MDNKLLTLCLTGSLVAVNGVATEPVEAQPVSSPPSGPIQTLAVSPLAKPAAVERDSWKATSVKQLAAIKAAAAVRKARAATRANVVAHPASVAAKPRTQLAARIPSSSRPSVAVAAYSGLAVYNEAKRYLGVPYVFGGASFNGIDCSGLVLRAFAKFGIHLPHSAMAQAARGVRIPISQARRGDLVIIPGQHIGFWHSPGMFLEAAHPGTLVRIHSIWANYYVVRILR